MPNFDKPIPIRDIVRKTFGITPIYPPTPIHKTGWKSEPGDAVRSEQKESPEEKSTTKDTDTRIKDQSGPVSSKASTSLALAKSNYIARVNKEIYGKW
ncbi:hypothetical protein PMZ80_010532 [Knufia obscura]|uniref:Uncharacterized protein n=2 Tax=Knufia TaxID=430999 RepID=A0AAN8EI29_9EURO|nr:hypothetical protein PMZ80_010532 [Knufia obscura]KAK5950115.1 hypothetical protein OHC33_008830 [Knufia fluminis]